MAAPRLEPDEVIGGRYRIVELLGEGGMGVVYRAEHTHMRKLFALKVLHRELLSMPEVVSRFEREAVLAGSINHPNVAAATDFGKLPDGSFFLVLELVVGKSLRELIAEGPVPVTRALPIMRGMLAGVGAAHAKGIVHRDLKPDNVMLVERDGASDFVKVLDFGIAKGEAMPEAAQKEGAQPLTRIGTIMGTPQYMSPEQAVGATVDLRSDLYALGVIFYELLTGAAPFDGDALQILRQHLTTQPPPIPDALVAGTTAPIVAIVQRLLAKEPEARFQTAAEVLSAFDGAPASVEARAEAANGAIVAAPDADRVTSAADRIAPGDTDEGLSPRTRKIAMASAAIGCFVLAAVVVSILSSHPDAAATADTEASASATPVSGLVAPPPVAVAATATATAIPTPLASASEDPEPEAAPSAAAASPAPAPGAQGRPSRGRRSAPGQPAPRRTGPGGIYIPPPKDWFK